MTPGKRIPRVLGRATAFLFVLCFAACLSTPSKQSPDSGGTDTPMAGTDCHDIVLCTFLKKCKDLTCIETCRQGADLEARVLYDEFIICQNKACEEFDTNDQPGQAALCAYSTCEKWAKQCFPTGNDSCSEVMDCILACDYNKTCMDNCIWEGTYDAQVLYVGFWRCIEVHCDTDASDYSCLLANCGGAYAVCKPTGV
ncbi:MAG: hypothetical protein ISR64_03855 [Deltaproteobacteria bacterium]|nr:hypothetical protein [Deltaproteobacteria bacterium]